jgi:hypothetical protein
VTNANYYGFKKLMRRYCDNAGSLYNMMYIPLSSKSWNSISRVSAPVTGEKCVYGGSTEFNNVHFRVEERGREGVRQRKGKDIQRGGKQVERLRRRKKLKSVVGTLVPLWGLH